VRSKAENCLAEVSDNAAFFHFDGWLVVASFDPRDNVDDWGGYCGSAGPGSDRTIPSRLSSGCLLNLHPRRDRYVFGASGRGRDVWRSYKYGDAFGSDDEPQFRFCPPPQATPKQVMPILSEFLDKNPNALKFDIRDVMNYVGRLNWPCR
jgi:hypothetical protein